MNLIATIRNMIMRVRVDRPSGQPQVTGLGERAYPEVEHFQGPGVAFTAPAGAHGFGFSPGGDPSSLAVIGLDGDKPEAPAAGEGGLHYLGTYKVFLAADGSVHLGQKDPDDFVACAGPTNQLFQDLANAISGWTPVATDGGAALKVALAAWLTAAASADVGSSVVKVQS